MLALEAYRRQRFLEQLIADYAALHVDPAASAAYRAETAEWDTTLEDGLPVEPPASREEQVPDVPGGVKLTTF